MKITKYRGTYYNWIADMYKISYVHEQNERDEA